MRLTGYLQSVEELNSGPPKTNPSSGREEDLNPGPPDYKSSALTTRPRCPPGGLPFLLNSIYLLITIYWETSYRTTTVI